jgi:hypothetical protein
LVPIWATVSLLDLSQSSQAGHAIVKCVDPDDHGINSAHFVV